LPASRPKVLTPVLASAIDPLTDAAGAARSEPNSMQDVKPSSLYPVESDHQRETAQISAEPSSAFDGDGEPRFDAARFVRPSGVETVRAELMVDRHNAHRLRVYAEARANSDLARAARLFNAFWSAPMVPGVESLAWSECCTDTVRRWVAVAREAARS
jgi:hypothetical protein